MSISLSKDGIEKPADKSFKLEQIFGNPDGWFFFHFLE